MKYRIIALFLALLLLPVIAFAEDAPEPEYVDVTLIIDGVTIGRDGSPAPEGTTVHGLLYNDVLYLPAGIIPTGLSLDVTFDEDTYTLIIRSGKEVPEEPVPSHCWVLRDTVHEVQENEQDGPRTWLYEYRDVEGSGRYVIDYTWNYHDEYSHYTALGECTNPPAYVLPGQRFTVTLKVWNENVVGDRGWGILGMGYIQYDRDSDSHYANTKGFENVVEDGPRNYNAKDGDFEWQLWAEFPEGVEGETISFDCSFHRGDKHPVGTTWTYVWVD